MSLAERVQREHELLRAYEAAQRLAELLEMAGRDPAPARAIRDSLSGSSGTDVRKASEYGVPQQRDLVVTDPPCPSCSTITTGQEP